MAQGEIRIVNVLGLQMKHAGDNHEAIFHSVVHLLQEKLVAHQCGLETALVPITLGLSVLVALMQTAWYRTGNAKYLAMTKFWARSSSSTSPWAW